MGAVSIDTKQARSGPCHKSKKKKYTNELASCLIKSFHNLNLIGFEKNKVHNVRNVGLMVWKALGA